MTSSSAGLVLRALQVSDERAFRAAVAEFEVTDPGWEFAFRFGADVDFAGYVDRLNGWPRGQQLPDRWVANTYLVAEIDGAIVGRTSLRHELDDWLRENAGHIGYGVVASARRRGYGREILRQTLVLARDRGIGRALLMCDEDNIASVKIIESCGGVFEGTGPRDGGGTTCRYWIDTGADR